MNQTDNQQKQTQKQTDLTASTHEDMTAAIQEGTQADRQTAETH